MYQYEPGCHKYGTFTADGASNTDRARRVASEDDTGTIAWCPGCKRFVLPENEAEHARTKHVQSFDGDIESRYRRVPRALLEGRERIVTDGGEDLPKEHFTLAVDGKQVWHTDGHGEEYDAIHAAAGALLAGADDVVIRRHNDAKDGESE